MTVRAAVPRPAGPPCPRTLLRAAEFFAGIGLARLGLRAAGVEVVWANDVDPDKAAMYAGHFGDTSAHFELGDIGAVIGAQLPELDLAWASFPCTDLSLAGNRDGLSGRQSGAFWEFTRVLDEMGARRPRVVAVENVVGLATSHRGADLASAIRDLNRIGYSVDALTIDARRFVPQSRPRLFLVGAMDPPADAADPVSELRPEWLQGPYRDSSLRTHRAELPNPPELLPGGFGDIVQTEGVQWWDQGHRQRFLDSLSDVQAERLNVLRGQRRVSYRTAYRRTRNGVAVWEIRPDDIAGCLRTARGGSSKQAVVKAGRGEVEVRWMTPLEYARLQGAGDFNIDGVRPSQAVSGFGDAVCVPVVAWLTEHYLAPLIKGELGS